MMIELPDKIGNTPTDHVIEIAANMLQEASDSLGYYDFEVFAKKLKEMSRYFRPAAVNRRARLLVNALYRWP